MVAILSGGTHIVVSWGLTLGASYLSHVLFDDAQVHTSLSVFASRYCMHPGRAGIALEITNSIQHFTRLVASPADMHKTDHWDVSVSECHAPQRADMLNVPSSPNPVHVAEKATLVHIQ